MTDKFIFMILDISRAAVAARPSLDAYSRYVAWAPDCELFVAPEGREHYRLLSYVASVMARDKGTGRLEVADVGTFKGYSAIALASGAPNVHVTSYDIIDAMPAEGTPSAKSVSNVTFKKMNCFDDMSTICKADLICCDVDPHDGLQERRFVDELQAVGFKGILICDDIGLGPGMVNFWTSVTQQKYDVTLVGHWSNTGLVVFDPSLHQVRGDSAILTV